MKGVYVPTKRTTVNPDALRDALASQLSRRGIKADLHALNGLVAMSAHETGVWRSCYNYNLGNVKAGVDWPGQYMCLNNVWEVLKGKTRWFSPRGEISGRNGTLIGPEYPVPAGHPQTRFRAYPTLEAGVEGWALKMAGMYRPALDILLAGGSTDAFLTQLKKQRYFTGDLVKYQKSVRSYYVKFSGATPDRPRLALGSTGEDVADLQRALELDDDGEFGPKTNAAVRQMQESFGLVVDGVVGQKSWPYVEKLLALADLDLAAAVRAVLRG
jgi:hypothetical protein